MIFIKLPGPVILKSCTAGNVKLLGVDQHEYECVLGYAKFVDVDSAGQVHFYSESEFIEAGLQAFADDRTGTNGILYLANALGVSLSYLNYVDIPADVWRETRHEWDHICHLCSRVELRADRLRRLLELGAPEIILRNERRMVWEAVCALDDNTSYSVTWGNGDHVISLKEVEYDLSTGDWTSKKKNFLAEREAAYQAEWELEQEELDEE